MKGSGYMGVTVALGMAMFMIGCGETERNLPPERERGAEVGSEMAAEVADTRSVVLFLGTSLTAGFGLPPEQAYPTLIQERIDAASLPFAAVNAGVSGETSAGALRRIDWLLRQPFDILVLETGANDMLRGLDPAETEANIQAIVDRVRQERPATRIVLAGMLSMPNLGEAYTRRFEPIYPRLAERNDLVLIPFLLEGVAGERHLNLGDGIHPNQQGQRIIAATVWEVLEPVLRARTVDPE